MNLNIKTTGELDGTIKVYVENYGITWAKNMHDLGFAVAEIVESIRLTELKFKNK